MDRLVTILATKGSAVHIVAPETTVLDAVDKMCRARVGSLVVMDEQTLVGIFSERDLMTRVVLEQRDPATTHVGEVMTTSVISVTRDTSSHDAMALMSSRRVRHLPVTDGAARVVGIVSIGDLVRWVVTDRERLIDELEGYVAGRYPG
jgi:CBS domain-containing protein